MCAVGRIGALLAVIASTFIVQAQSKKALFVVGSLGSSPSDDDFRNALETAGYEVVLEDDDTVALAAFVIPTVDLIVVSASTSSSKVGSTFKNSAIPFLSWEEGVYDDMGMVVAGAGSNYYNGAASTFWASERPEREIPYFKDQTDVTIHSAASGCALSAGLSGDLSVFQQPYSMSWGIPTGAGASVVATIDNGHKAVIFAYDQGAQLADGSTAAGKRVAFFPYHFSVGKALNTTGGTSAAMDPASCVTANCAVPLTAAGRTLLEAAIAMDLTGCAAQPMADPSTALFAVGSLNLQTDLDFYVALTLAGYRVRLVDDDAVSAAGYVIPAVDLVVVSASTSSGKISAVFKDLAVPFLSWEEGVYDDMGMTAGGGTNVANGAASSYWRSARPNQSIPYLEDLSVVEISAEAASCPLSAGLQGILPVYSQNFSMSWGLPTGPGASVVATIGGGAKAVIFAYAKGSELADGTKAAGDRVAFFPYHFSVGDSLALQADGSRTAIAQSDCKTAGCQVPLTEAGQKLLSAAIKMNISGCLPSVAHSSTTAAALDESSSACGWTRRLISAVLIFGSMMQFL
eukprot:TRINITY_DN52_c0_g1_i2.p1 TRINITY_DN52_c0_g1~~TRINITY_DN52_c0_g1_i2.p1  ORF type:complete len:573 (-),score=96.35 TRINITY_DN52_c0_g1_i2:486-2204(-)